MFGQSSVIQEPPMGLFKRAAVRGIAHELVRRKMAQFPTKQALDEAADAVADHMPETGPEVSPEGGHSPETVVAIANRLMEIAQQLMAEASGGAPGGAPGDEAPPMGGGPGGPPPPPEALAAKEGAEQLFKFAAESDYEAVASDVAVQLMDKAAAEQKQAGSLIQGGDKGNDQAQSKKVTEMSALDLKNRPEGAYHHGAGKTELETNKGEIGDLEKHPNQPGASPSGSNSVTEGVGKKAAALSEVVQKFAGSLIQGGDKKNTFEAAAKVTEIGKLDQKNRPEGYAHVGQGNTNFSEPQTARIGLEKKPDVMPHNTPSGTNSVIQASKTSEDMSDEDKAYLAVFSKCAEDVGQYLPPKMTEETKIAAIRHMMGMDHDERQMYITTLEKQAGDLSDAIAGMKGDEEKKPEKKEEKKEVKKEGALMDQIRKIASASATPSNA